MTNDTATTDIPMETLIGDRRSDADNINALEKTRSNRVLYNQLPG